MMDKTPLFPLNLVLYPDSILPLRIFEIRYIDMVGECLRTQKGFGINLIKYGEAGKVAQCFDVGTYAEIIDWDRLEDGLLGIVVRGKHRYRVQGYSVRDNNLLEGELKPIAPEPALPCLDKHQALQRLLTKVIEHYQLPYGEEMEKITDMSWLGYRLAELLPLEHAIKQELLELSDAAQRLRLLKGLIVHSSSAD